MWMMVVIDDNTVLFVVIHELAHIMTHEVGHTPLFWNNMKYLLEVGEKVGIYQPVNYSENQNNIVEWRLIRHLMILVDNNFIVIIIYYMLDGFCNVFLKKFFVKCISVNSRYMLLIYWKYSNY